MVVLDLEGPPLLLDRQVITTSADGTAKVFDLESGANGGTVFSEGFWWPNFLQNPPEVSRSGELCG